MYRRSVSPSSSFGLAGLLLLLSGFEANGLPATRCGLFFRSAEEVAIEMGSVSSERLARLNGQVTVRSPRYPGDGQVIMTFDGSVWFYELVFPPEIWRPVRSTKMFGVFRVLSLLLAKSAGLDRFQVPTRLEDLPEINVPVGRSPGSRLRFEAAAGRRVADVLIDPLVSRSDKDLVRTLFNSRIDSLYRAAKADPSILQANIERGGGLTGRPADTIRIVPAPGSAISFGARSVIVDMVDFSMTIVDP